MHDEMHVLILPHTQFILNQNNIVMSSDKMQVKILLCINFPYTPMPPRLNKYEYNSEQLHSFSYFCAHMSEIFSIFM